MVRSNVDTTRHYAATTLANQPREYIPLMAAAATLLFGMLPMVSVPWLDSTLDSMRINAYQLPAGALLVFVSFPVMLVLIWALDRWLSGFERYAKFVFTGAAALQVASLWFLTTAASQALTQTMESMHINAAAIPQRLGVGFFLLLGVGVLFLVSCGLQLIKPKPSQPAPVRFPEKEPEAVTLK